MSATATTCGECGAPIELAADHPVTCAYCGASNAPLPKEVQVAVPVQIIENVVIAPDGVRPGGERCPHCCRPLDSVKVGAVELDGCRGCGGIWVDNQSARALMAAPEPVFAELADNCAKNARNAPRRNDRPPCPVCGAILAPVVTHGIQLDICSEHGTWFDAYELECLVKILRGEIEERVAVKPGSPAMVKCAVCKTAIRADRANISQRGPACESCWRRLMASEDAAAQKRIYEGGSALLAGGLGGIAAVMLGAADRS